MFQSPVPLLEIFLIDSPVVTNSAMRLRNTIANGRIASALSSDLIYLRDMNVDSKYHSRKYSPRINLRSEDQELEGGNYISSCGSTSSNVCPVTIILIKVTIVIND
jgi:hypothetical protein